MKTLLEKAQALFALSRDWFAGKEKELHQGSAALHVAMAEELEALCKRIEALESIKDDKRSVSL